MDDELRKHPADRDYSQWNLPDEAQLTENFESAMVLADMFNGRRGVGPDGRGFFSRHQDPPMITQAPISDSPPPRFQQGQTVLRPDTDVVMMPSAEYVQKFDAAVKSMQTEPGELGAVDRALAEDCLTVIRDRVRRLRESGVGDTVVGTHACNSIDLGLVGIAKLMGAE